MQKIIHRAEEMRLFAAEVGETLKPATLLLLVGDLGTGKTTFVQGLAAWLGITAVASPSFTIMSQYDVPTHPTIRVLVHVDLYRLTAEHAQADPLITEVIDSSKLPDRLTVIEWADRLGTISLPGALTLHFGHGSTTRQRVVRYDHAQ